MITELKEIWIYRKIISQLIALAFKTQFRQSIIGPFWHVIQPLVSSGVLVVVFKEILGTAQNIENPFLTFFSAIVFWNVFLQTFSSSAYVLEHNKDIFSKIYFPRVIPILSNIGITFFRFILQLVLFYIILLCTESDITVEKLVMIFFGSILIFIHIGLIGMGLGMLFASVSVIYKDLLISIPFLCNILFFATPIVYEIESITSGIKNYILLNPLSIPVQTAKELLQGELMFNFEYWTSFGCSLLIFVISLIIFTKGSKSFVDTI